MLHRVRPSVRRLAATGARRRSCDAAGSVRESAPEAATSSARIEVAVGVAALLVAGACLLLPLADLVGAALRALAAGEGWEMLRRAGQGLVLAVVGFGVLAHVVARTACYYGRARDGGGRDGGDDGREALPAADSPAWPAGDDGGARVVMLVPSYREHAEVVRRTLVSCALQEDTAADVMLLIDDPPYPGEADDRRLLAEARALSGQIQAWLDGLARPLREGLEAAEAEEAAADPAALEAALADALAETAQSLEAAAREWGEAGHEAVFFGTAILRPPAAELRARAAFWREQAAGTGCTARPTSWRAPVTAEYRRWLARLDARVASFERKLRADCTHKPSKAANLDAWLATAAAEASARTLPEFVVVVDADTILLPAYVRRALAWLRQGANARVAVVQSPYRAFPGARVLLERLAGATTDIQYLVHQGMSRRSAAFWVGANAVLRTAALAQLRREEVEDGRTVVRMLHDCTAIEDTETSLELVARGWRIHSLDAHLAFSSTPADFGALLVQRMRWANGGLLLLGRLARAGARAGGLRGAGLRLHYLVSLGPTAAALLVLPLCALDAGEHCRWLPGLALVWFGLSVRDLRLQGYRRLDAVGVYALNLLLVPVHFAGMLASVVQAAIGARATFRRTPKICERTAIPGTFVAAELALLALWGVACWDLTVAGRPLHAALVAAHAALLGWAFTVCIGWRAGVVDFLADLRGAPLAEVQPTREAG